MILVTLGTQKEQFPRLLDMIEKSKLNEKIVVQLGHTKYTSSKMELFNFINYDKMNELIDEADIVITHGGTGSILSPLYKGKKVIACARLAKYEEHVDNHQEEIVNLFAEEGYILKLTEDDKLDDIIKIAKNFKPKKYQSNTKEFMKALEKEINEAE